MDLACYKCGHVMEEGVPFCPHCAAPQIRVVVAEPVAAPAIAAVPAEAAALPASQTVPVLALPMRWSDALRPCALAALVASLLMSMGLNPFVAMFTVGVLAVLFYRQRRPQIGVKALSGAGLGALAGLLWFAISSVVEAMFVLLLHKGPELRGELINRIQQAASQTNDPQVSSMLERFKSPDGLQILMFAGIFFAFLASVVLSALGGALMASVFGGRNRTP